MGILLVYSLLALFMYLPIQLFTSFGTSLSEFSTLKESTLHKEIDKMFS